jgi:hypothetical protein
MTYHDPATDADRRTDAFEVSDCFFHGVGAAARATDATRFGIPGAVFSRREVVALQILHTTRTTTQDDDVRALTRHPDVQGRSSYPNHPRIHVRARYQRR